MNSPRVADARRGVASPLARAVRATGLALAFSCGLTLPGASPAAGGSAASLPDGFVFVEDVVPGVRVDLHYSTANNFIGRPVRGYDNARAVLSEPAARALAGVQAELKPFGLTLLVYDAYRPQRAVDHFVEWAKDPNDDAGRAEYYPTVPKDRLFPEGYIAERSGHTRGSTVDLTLADAASGEPLDMGTRFDFLGPESWPDYPGVTPQQRANRLLLRTFMVKHGFRPLQQEWWHFTLQNEPFPERYFDFLPR